MARAAQIERSTIARRAGDPSRDASEVPAEPRALPLDLAPLLAPYKKHGRLSLRVERLPQFARLSKGSRNGDGSWSLTRDELEDLEYLVPEGMDGEHTLAVRIVSLVGGNTLAVLEIPVSPGAARADAAPARDVAGAGEDAQLRRLLDELAQAKAALASRDSELAEARQSAEEAKQALDAELATARAAWTTELDEHLAAATATAATDLRQHRDAWEADQKARVATSEERAQAELAEARERWQREAQDALLKAESAWKSNEAARLAAAEAQWQGGKVELQGVREKLATLEAALARADKAAEAAREGGRQETQDALLKAEQSWKAGEAARLAAAEAQWQAKAAIPPAATDDREGESELRALREKLAALQATLAERDAALAEAKEARERETREALAKAEQAWKADEATRLAAAEAQWKATAPPPAPAGADRGDDELRAKLAEVTARCESAEAALGNARVRAREELAAVNATLAKRDEELARARAASQPVSRGYEPPPTPTHPSRIRELVSRPDDGAQDKRTFMWEIIVAVVLGVAGVMFYPTIEAFIFGAPHVAVRVVPIPRAKPELPVAPVVERTATLARDAKLRADALPAAAVVASLKSGASVVIVEERAKWVQVRAGDKTGWVKSSFLKDITPAAAPVPAADPPSASPPIP